MHAPFADAFDPADQISPHPVDPDDWHTDPPDYDDSRDGDSVFDLAGGPIDTDGWDDDEYEWADLR